MQDAVDTRPDQIVMQLNCLRCALTFVSIKMLCIVKYLMSATTGNDIVYIVDRYKVT